MGDLADMRAEIRDVPHFESVAHLNSPLTVCLPPRQPAALAVGGFGFALPGT